MLQFKKIEHGYLPFYPYSFMRLLDGHRHNAAIRYMIKQFAMDLYVEWRTIEGLEVRPSYSEEFLGKVHSA